MSNVMLPVHKVRYWVLGASSSASIYFRTLHEASLFACRDGADLPTFEYRSESDIAFMKRTGEFFETYQEYLDYEA